MDGQLVHDLRRRAGGRGAYVVVDEKCLARALQGGFARSFKGRIEAPPLEELIESMSRGIHRRLKETLQVGVRARQTALGAQALSEAMRQDEVTLVLVADDAGGATASKFINNAKRKGIRIARGFTGGELGPWLGRDFLAVCGVTDADRASAITRDLEHLAKLESFEG